MKKSNLKKFLSAAAVLAISATAALSAISFAACAGDKTPSADAGEKLIVPDENHSSNVISTALGPVTNQTSGRKYYVAPDGVNTNDGLSWDKPIDFSTILLREQNPLQPGDTVYLKPGTYRITSGIVVPTWVKGEYNKYIRIVNAAYEKAESGYNGTETLCTLDFSEQYFASTGRGVEMTGDYIYWYGIDICGAGDNGLYIGGSYNTVEFSEFYNNRDTGLQLGRSDSGRTSFEQWPSYNLIKNCTSHNNYDNETYGENADGFAAKLTVGYGNVFDGCIAYRNSDDGWDLYAKTDSGNIGCVIIYNCVAFENGYLEYTQRQMNELWPNYHHNYDEPELDTYKTRDGDGNGFKLGGSVMEGDVQLHNCLAFYNRMHGVTDNSNPGYLNIDGVTSIDNSAAIDDNKNSPTFGQIIRAENHDTHNNIDVSRQTYSYNTVKNTLSVNSEISVSTGSDRYRGSVINSILGLGSASAKANYIEGTIDADSKNVGGVTFTTQGPALVASDIFEAIAIDVSSEVVGDGEAAQTVYSYQYNLTGLGDLYAQNYRYKDYDSTGYDYTQGFEHSITDFALNVNRVHVRFRNDDNSINMGQFYNLKEGKAVINETQIGSHLNETSWDKYVHFFDNDFINGAASSENQARLERAAETLTINTDVDAVYQDFEVPLKMNKVKISWASSNTDIVKIGTEVETSISTSEYITIMVYRPLSEDAHVTLTATLTVGEGDAAVTTTKDFNLTIVHGTPSIGTIFVKTQTGDIVHNGGSYIVDRFNIFREPTVMVENGIDYNGKLLNNSQFTYKTSYTYAPDKSSAALAVKGFTPSNDGVYTVTVTVTLASDTTQSASITYTLYVSSRTANVDFMRTNVGTADEAVESALNINLDGYMISGSLTNATGKIYALSSPTQLNVTPSTIKTTVGVKSYTFRSDFISFQFENANNSAYYVYYALANLNDEITSSVYEKEVGVVNISSAQDFVKMAGGEKVGEENPATTIYSLTNDIAFTANDNKLWANKGKSSFTGLFNGNGHTISGVNVQKGTEGENGTASMFYKVEGGTIKNVKFDNVTISGGKQQTGIVGTCYGGYFHNIALTNINVSGTTRVGGLIGHVFESSLPTKISFVSLTDSTLHSTSHRLGGIVGFIQSTGSPMEDVNVYISDCYVIANLSGYQQVGGILGAFDNAKPTINYYLEINRCYFDGTVSSTYSTPRIGGMIGYQSGAIGHFKITSCLSVGELYAYDSHIRVSVPLKSASLIVGGYSTVALNEVSNCVATMQEYNSDFDVNLFTARNLERGLDDLVYYLGIGKDDANWKYQYKGDAAHPDYLAKPYLKLNFIEQA